MERYIRKFLGFEVGERYEFSPEEVEAISKDMNLDFYQVYLKHKNYMEVNDDGSATVNLLFMELNGIRCIEIIIEGLDKKGFNVYEMIKRTSEGTEVLSKIK